MKKLKQFLFIFVPLLLVIAIQFLATYFAMGLSPADRERLVLCHRQRGVPRYCR